MSCLKRYINIVSSLIVIISLCHSTFGQGLGVFGNSLGIHSSSGLAVQGHLYLEDAQLITSGPLIMADTQRRHIVAQNSSLAHLQIQSQGTVTLYGKLVITNSLLIKSGTLDARSALLVLTDTTEVLLHDLANLLLPTHLAAHPSYPETIHYLTPSFPRIAIIVWTSTNIDSPTDWFGRGFLLKPLPLPGRLHNSYIGPPPKYLPGDCLGSSPTSKG